MSARSIQIQVEVHHSVRPIMSKSRRIETTYERQYPNGEDDPRMKDRRIKPNRIINYLERAEDEVPERRSSCDSRKKMAENRELSGGSRDEPSVRKKFTDTPHPVLTTFAMKANNRSKKATHAEGRSWYRASGELPVEPGSSSMGRTSRSQGPREFSKELRSGSEPQQTRSRRVVSLRGGHGSMPADRSSSNIHPPEPGCHQGSSYPPGPSHSVVPSYPPGSSYPPRMPIIERTGTKKKRQNVRFVSEVDIIEPEPSL